MEKKVHRYTGDGIEVTWDKKRCIHAAECIRGLPAVFDTSERPWVQPEEAPNEDVAAVIHRCPTGALHYRREQGPAEEPPAANALRVAPDGPVYAEGRVEIEGGDGEELLSDVRVALCRCGLSSNKPLCDNSHRDGFSDPGRIGECSLDDGTGEDAAETLTLRATSDGPLVLRGPFRLTGADGRTVHGEKAALCRCGESKNKPFCDGSHTAAGFSG